MTFLRLALMFCFLPLFVLFFSSYGQAQQQLRSKRVVRPNKITIKSEKTSNSSVSEEDESEITYRVELDERESRFLLGVYGQVSQFSFEGRGLLGSAVEVSASYALTHKVAANFSVAQALDPSSLSILYTGFRVSGGYAFFGNFIQRESVLQVGGQTSFISKLGRGPLFAADIGMEQLLFNGTGRIVPATGVSAGVRYDRSLWRLNVSFIARYGQLVIAEKTSSMVSGGVGLMMRF